MNNEQYNSYNEIKEKKNKYGVSKLNYYHKIKHNKIICDICGGQYDMYHKSLHFNTKKHINGEIRKKNAEIIENLKQEIDKLHNQILIK